MKKKTYDFDFRIEGITTTQANQLMKFVDAWSYNRRAELAGGFHEPLTFWKTIALPFRAAWLDWKVNHVR